MEEKDGMVIMSKEEFETIKTAYNILLEKVTGKTLEEYNRETSNQK
jgi:hypothetical protein